MEAPRIAILFADIAGSTRLYERLGDVSAREIVSTVIEHMTKIVEQHRGVLIKTIGDEIMCRFDGADEAVDSCIAIQEALRDRRIPSPVPVLVRCGMHFGPALLENGDVFGDAVNVAARVAAIAKGGQIITTQATVEALSPPLAQKTRLIDATAVKGKEEELEIFEVVWEEANATMIVSSPSGPLLTPAETLLTIEFQNQKRVMHPGETLSLGRSEQCDLVIPSSLASRQHARIEYRRGKFILIDQSTNGTVVQTEDNNRVFLKREELPLWGSGLFALGEEIDLTSDLLIRFSC